MSWWTCRTNWPLPSLKSRNEQTDGLPRLHANAARSPSSSTGPEPAVTGFYDETTGSVQYLVADLSPDATHKLRRPAGSDIRSHKTIGLDADTNLQNANHIVIDVSGFSDGFGTFQKKCASARCLPRSVCMCCSAGTNPGALPVVGADIPSSEARASEHYLALAIAGY